MVWFASLYISHISSLLKNKMICRTLPFPPPSLSHGCFCDWKQAISLLHHLSSSPCHTTRAAYFGEENRLDYHFVSQEAFQKMLKAVSTSLVFWQDCLLQSELNFSIQVIIHSYVNEYESSYKTTKSSLYIYVVFSSVCIHRNYSLSLMVSRNF